MTIIIQWFADTFYSLASWIASFLPACPVVDSSMYSSIKNIMAFMYVFARFYPIDFMLYMLGIYILMVLGIFTFKLLKWFVQVVRG